MSPAVALAGSIVLSALAQIALKHGTAQRQAVWGRRSASATLWLLAWGAGFLMATFLWIEALTRFDVSYAYPLLGLGYVLVTGLAALLLRERVSRLHWAAVLLIATGAAVVAGSV